MPISELPIFCSYDKQRFTQFGSMDCANWYLVAAESGKRQKALYPAMGRKHVTVLNQNRLLFNAQPRALFRSIDYVYIVDGSTVYQVDKSYNKKAIGNVGLTSKIWFAFLPVGNLVYCMMTDESNIYVITENGTNVSMATVTDTHAPTKPLYVAAFGNRFVVSQKGTPDYFLSTINLDGTVADYFTVSGAALSNRASGVIGQFAVLHGQLYIMCSFTTDIWGNIPTRIKVGLVTLEFPWKLNTSYNWDYGIADAFSLDVDFGRMTWLAQNRNGLVTFMASNGQMPEDISTEAVDVLLQNASTTDGLSPFLEATSEGFLYQYENTIFYRISAGNFLDFGDLDIVNSANALEFNFETKTWARVIELNGERSRIQKHVFFNNKHLVTVEDDTAVYQMAGNIYYNELRNALQPDGQAADAFIKFPMRYELTTKQIFEQDYSEFITDYIEIDFVFGDKTFYQSNAPFLNTVYVVTEDSTPEAPIYVVSEDDKFVIQDGTNTPTFDDSHYNALFKPHIEVYYSDDGGVTFLTADVLEFSPLGQYRWRMRWYQLGASRNRCYKLVCVSSAPIVILGAVQNARRASGGAN